MANFYCKPDGDDTLDGTSYDNAKATINGLLDVDYTQGDRLYVAPGTYRELVDIDRAPGRRKTNNGTVSLTEGSTTVTGSGSDWLSKIAEGDLLWVRFLAEGTDGVYAGGPDRLTSASANFEATINNFVVNMWNAAGNDGGSYMVTWVAGNQVNLTDINNLGFPAAAGGYIFRVPSCEGAYEIASVESDTSLTLKRPWSGPTYSGRSYEITRPAYLIGDNTGAYTDGVGGIVRVTGSTNDQTAARQFCIDCDEQDHWVIRGFQVDSATADNIHIKDTPYVVIEDIMSLNPGESHIHVEDESDRVTIKRCVLLGGDNDSYGIEIESNVGDTVDYAIHIENVYCDCRHFFYVNDVSSITIKSCTNGPTGYKFLETAQGYEDGQTVFIHDCEVHNCLIGLDANVLGQILANFNNYWGNNAGNDYVNVDNNGATETTVMWLPEMPLLVDDYRYPVRLFPPSEWWAERVHTGLYPANEDIYGILRPSTKTQRSLGYYQDIHVERDEDTTYGGADASLMHPEARTTSFRVPINGDAVTVSVQVYLEANYAGTYNPKLVVHQDGNTDAEDVSSGSTATWEELSVNYTPDLNRPLNLWVELVSDSDGTGAAHAVYWQWLVIEVT